MAEENPKWREAKEREEAAETMRRIYASQQRDHSLYIRDRAKFEIFDKLTFRGPWSADILRELHKLAYKGGEFENDVWVGKFRGEYGAYEPEGMNFSGVKRAKVKDGVEELVKWMNLCDATNLPTQRFAAQAFLSFIRLHPFGDENGRSGQLLINLILRRSSNPPFIIKEDYRKQISTLLKEKDDKKFINFLMVVDAMCVRMCSNPSTLRMKQMQGASGFDDGAGGRRK